jgi:nicotinamidase-related amidase
MTDEWRALAARHSLTSTDPYPWPYDGAFGTVDTAVVLCGWQAGLRDGSSAASAPFDAAARLAGVWASAGGMVVVVRHGDRAAGRSILPVTDSPEWSALAAPPTAFVVDATGWDGCFGSALEHELRRAGIVHVLLAGMASELTVDSTVRTLNDRGFECLVLVDACAPVDPDLGAHAHHSLTMSGGIFGALGTTDEVLAAPPAPPTYAPNPSEESP